MKVSPCCCVQVSMCEKGLWKCNSCEKTYTFVQLVECHESDPVNSPSHYKSNGMEAIDVIEAFELNFNLGNALKYILRSERKENKIQDIKKAIWYLNRQINEPK